MVNYQMCARRERTEHMRKNSARCSSKPLRSSFISDGFLNSPIKFMIQAFFFPWLPGNSSPLTTLHCANELPRWLQTKPATSEWLFLSVDVKTHQKQPTSTSFHWVRGGLIMSAAKKKKAGSQTLERNCSFVSFPAVMEPKTIRQSATKHLFKFPCCLEIWAHWTQLDYLVHSRLRRAELWSVCVLSVRHKLLPVRLGGLF